MGNSLASAKFRGFVEVLCEGETLSVESFYELVQEVDLFNLSIDLADFVSKFSLEDAKDLIRNKPNHAGMLLEVCAEHLDREIALLLLSRLVPCYFILRPEDGNSPPLEENLDDLTFQIQQFCLKNQLDTEAQRRLFVLANSQTLFSKQVCVDRNMCKELNLPEQLISKLFASKQHTAMHCLAILTDIKHDCFVFEAEQATRVIKSKLEQKQDIVPSIVVLLRMCEDDPLAALVDKHCVDLTKILIMVVELIAEHCQQAKKDPALVQLCSVVLLCMSANRRIALQLNTNPKHMDVVVKSVCTFLRDGDIAAFTPVQRLCLTALVNVSFYCKQMSMPSSSNLVSLFERCVKLQRLDTAGVLVSIFSNILQYQSQGNAALTYCMFRSKQAFLNMRHALQQQQQPIENEDLEICLLALNEVDFMLKESTKVDSRMDDILQQISSLSLIGVLPVPRPMVVSRYTRSDKIDQVIRKCFWLDLYQNTEEYWDFWTSM